jgi:hypothetical protein
MTNLAAIVLIMAIGLAQFYLFILLDRMRKERKTRSSRVSLEVLPCLPATDGYRCTRHG